MKMKDSTENILWKRSDYPDELKQQWKNRTLNFHGENDAKKSAVLMTMVYQDGQYQFLFEERASALAVQPGEICFPGGVMEEGETGLDTAIRETCEELLIDPSQIEVIAPMDLMAGPAGAALYPFLSILHDYQGTLSRDEVERVFTVPVQWFFDNEPLRHMADLNIVPREGFPYHLIPNGEDYHWRKKPREILFFETPEAVIWGLTARLIQTFLDLCRLSLR